MKKYLYLLVITALTLSSLGQVTYANDSGGNQGSENNKSGWGRAFSGIFELKGVFNGNVNGQKEDANVQNKTELQFNGGLSQNNNKVENKDEKNEKAGSESQRNNFPRPVWGLAKVTAVSGSTITAVTTFKSNTKTWTISTDANTKFTSRTGGATLLTNINVGDLIGFSGTLTSKTDSSLSVSASAIRVWGDVDLRAHVVATGTVTSIDSSATQFTIVGSDGKSILVNSTDITRIKGPNHASSTFANISTGMTVKVKGFWNSLVNIITALKIKII